MVYQLLESIKTPSEKLDLQSAGGGLRSKQPFRVLFHILYILETFFVQLPIRTILYTLLPRFTRQHPQWTLSRSLFIGLLRNYRWRISPLHMRSQVTDKSILPQMSSNAEATPVWIQPVNRQTGLEGDLKAYFDAAGCVTNRVLAFWYGKDHSLGDFGGRRAQEGEKVYLYFHGGGYWEHSAHPSNPTMNCMRILLKASQTSTNKAAPKRGLAVDYRLTDETTFPGILADAVAGWMYLVREGFEPKNIIIGGDSAGGNLALALSRYIRDYRPLYEELNLSQDSHEPIADGLILFSPWIDISGSFVRSGPSASSRYNAQTDYLFESSLVKAGNALTRGLPIPALSSRWISCICTTRDIEADLFDEFPRALVFGG
ncbi:hypothetical protein CBS101457_006378 [Exobasidium rhododendri]|nr:hypothetical protein CBS101457_006378 [Exobasidium rhododendri]